MPTPEVLALADDLTGALEVGSLFAAQGAGAMVGIECAPEAAIPVIDLESRHLEPRAAAERVTEFAAGAGRFVFLKIDSTMRGPIAAEIAALKRLWPGRPIFFTPAYPAVGRTVVNGRVYVNGAPLHQTAFNSDPTHPARTSEIGEMLGDAGETVRVLDASSDECLGRIAEEIRAREAPVIVAGSGGLARQLAPRLPMARGTGRRLPNALQPMVVCGSMHGTSAEQIRFAGKWPVIECAAYSNGATALASIASRTRERVKERTKEIDTLIVFGGDTARALMRELGVRWIEPLGEALTGVPVSRIEYEGRALTLITKAGGFGGPDFLPRLAAILETGI